jgi:hypothetical protein
MAIAVEAPPIQTLGFVGAGGPVFRKSFTGDPFRAKLMPHRQTFIIFGSGLLPECRHGDWNPVPCRRAGDESGL